MVKSCLIFIFFVALCPWQASSQQADNRYPIKFKTGFGPFSPSYYAVRWEDTSFIPRSGFDKLSGINPDFRSVRQAIIWFEFAQYIYQSWKTGVIPTERYEALTQSINLKTEIQRLVPRKIKCYVNLVTAVNNKGDTIILLDRNNNHDLSDDVALNLSTMNAVTEQIVKEIQSVPYERLFAGKVITDTARISLTKGRLDFGYCMAEYAETELVMGEKKYPFFIFPEGFLSRSYYRSGILNTYNHQSDPYDSLVRNNEYFSLEGRIFKFDGVDIQRNEAVIHEMHGTEMYSPQVGFFAPPFEGRELLNDRIYSIAANGGKYTLIDFWGTWCLPCLKELPGMKSFYDNADTSKIRFLGVAVNDTPEDVTKLTDSKGISWPQIISDQAASLYNVTSFPSNFLLDPHGKIIAKDIKMNDLKDLLAALHSGEE